jgi:hypothetical protein
VVLTANNLHKRDWMVDVGIQGREFQDSLQELSHHVAFAANQALGDCSGRKIRVGNNQLIAVSHFHEDFQE